MIAICILTRNRFSVLRRLVDSLRPVLSPDVFLVVLDQASTDGTRQYLASEPVTAAWALYADHNLGCAGGRQRQVDFLRAVLQPDEIAVFLDDDCYATNATWLDALTGPIRRGEADICGVDGRHIDAHGMTWQLQPGEQPDYVSGGRMAVRAAVFEACAFDPRFNPNYYEDVDFCFQARAAGYHIAAVGDVGMAHDDHPGDATAAAKSMRAFVDKWRGRGL